MVSTTAMIAGCRCDLQKLTPHKSLKQVYPDEDSEASRESKVDIILVHGLNPKSKDDEAHAMNTWTENGRLWPKDDLSKKLPDARISLYMYDSSVVYGGSHATFADKADEFLETIRCDREDWEERPLILMGHSLGGILIEQALINARQNLTYLHIYEATVCLAFFGTPHNGGSEELVRVGKTATKVALGLGFQKGDNMIETLDKGSIFTDVLKNHFRQQFEKYRMVSFWGDKDAIVPRESSRFGLSGQRERIIELKADHHGVAAFGYNARDKDNLKKVLSNVSWLYKEALELVSEISKRLKWLMEGPNVMQKLALREVYWIVPFERNSCFTGRESELAQLEEMLFSENQTTKIAVAGLGGVGKTNLLIELVYQIREKKKDCSIIWLPATNTESLEKAYLDVAQKLGIPGAAEEKANVKRLVQEYLSRDGAGKWLLVFDNADEIDMWIPRAGSKQVSDHLIDYLPKSEKGCILFTTRDRKTAYDLVQRQNNIIEVPEMREEIALHLLQKYLPDQDLVEQEEDAKAFLKQLTNLPLAIVQAAAYINKNGIRIAEYLKLLDGQDEEKIEMLSEDFGDDWRYRDVNNPVATTWLVSFEQIRCHDPLAADYLSFMACIDPKDIPQSLLPPGSSRKKETDAIGTLVAYSFIVKRVADQALPLEDQAKEALDLHRLVHLTTRNWLRNQGRMNQWIQKAITRLYEVLPSDDHLNRSLWRMFLPHVQYALKSDNINQDSPSRTLLVWRSGTCLYADARYNEAEAQFVEVFETYKTKLGADHLFMLTLMSILASIYKNQGRYEEAEKLELQVIKTHKTKRGADYPFMLISMSNLASIYREQGRWEEAEKLGVQVIETRKSKLGADHPDTLGSISNLTSTYMNQGRWEEAEKLGVQVIETIKTKLGADHPNTLASMSNLASTFWYQGRWEEAEKLFVQVIKTSKTKLGADHLMTLGNMSNLASTYVNQRRWEKAENLGLQVMETRKTKLGADHLDTLTSMSILASIYKNQGRWKEAEILDVQVMETRKTKLGADHPDTLTSMSKLASTYKKQGRWKEAEILDVQVMETRKTKLGADHPDTLTSMNNLSHTWKAQGKTKEALALLEECVGYLISRLGMNHPNTQSSLRTLGFWREEDPNTQ